MRSSFLFKTFLLITLSGASLVYAGTGTVDPGSASSEESDQYVREARSILLPETRTGTVELNGGEATIKVPEGYSYLTASGANFVLEQMW